MGHLDEAVLIKGRIEGVSGPTVVASGMKGVRMHTTASVGKIGLIGEVIRLTADRATLQVYEDTAGLSLGEEVVCHGEPLTVLLGPGLLTNIFDGIQRPLEKMTASGGSFIERGYTTAPLDVDRLWDFSPLMEPGDEISGGDIVGTVRETECIEHRVMVPPGRGGVIKRIACGELSGRESVVDFEDGSSIGLFHRWPVREARPSERKLPPSTPFITGQRVFDTVIPVAEGGCAIVPGGFGTGKTMVEQAVAKFSLTDIVIYVGCGERGNEITDVLKEFPELKDPHSGIPLSERTIIIVNTSNMPVAAREASIFTGITIAEYYRDMGYRVALMADSLSRWAEALREISSRLEEMPGEEGYPPYLATLIGSFYERAGKVVCSSSTAAAGDGEARTGAVTVIGAISPPGGDFSEPVTQASLRFAGSLWALDSDLAYRRHYPAVSWEASYSLYYRSLAGWYATEVAPDMVELRSWLMALLQRESEVNEVAQIIGMDALQEVDRLTLETAQVAREAFLRQSVFVKQDAFATFEKQYWMLKAINAFMKAAERAVKNGVYIEAILESTMKTKLLKMQYLESEGFEEKGRSLIKEIERAFLEMQSA